MKKVLIWADYACGTGFANVAGNIARALHATGEYELDILAVNYTGIPYDRERWPGKIWPAKPGGGWVQKVPDIWGKDRLISMLEDNDYDVLFMIQDPKALVDTITSIRRLQEEGKKFKTIYYFPTDAPHKVGWVEYIIKEIDYPVSYTNYGLEEVKKISPEAARKCRVIYHGSGEDFFYVDPKLTAKFRVAIFKRDAAKFIIGNFNRNQPRKDIIRNFMILKELRKRNRTDAILYLHMKVDDVAGDLYQMGFNFGFIPGKDYYVPDQDIYKTENGMDIRLVNMLYNAVDCTLNTALGGGWELQTTESFITKTPTVAPNHTSFKEIMAENRGYLVRAGAGPSDWICLQNDEERLRPLMDVKDAAVKIEKIMDGQYPDIEGAYKWAKKNSWETINKRWLRLFETATKAGSK